MLHSYKGFTNNRKRIIADYVYFPKPYHPHDFSVEASCPLYSSEGGEFVSLYTKELVYAFIEDRVREISKEEFDKAVEVYLDLKKKFDEFSGFRVD